MRGKHGGDTGDLKRHSRRRGGVRRLCQLGKAVNSVSEIPADAAFFPVAEADWIRPAAPADLGRTRFRSRVAQPPTLLGLSQRPLRRWGQDARR
jgi:hypothetical protein